MATPDQATRTIENAPIAISSTAEANGVLIRVNAQIPDAVLQLLLYGTYTGGTVLVRARLAGMWDSNDSTLGIYAPISGLNSLSNAPVGTGGTFVLSDSATNNWRFAVGAYDWIEVYASALASGSISVAKSLTPPSMATTPVLDATVSGVSGTTGEFTTSLKLTDNATLIFGTGNDVLFDWDGTDLIVAQAAPDSFVKWGVSGAGINHLFYGDTATRDMTWDQTNDQLLFNDNAKIAIGTGGDITLLWNATKLLVGQAAANSAIDWGVDNAGIDQNWYGDTASVLMAWDQSADSLIFSDNALLVFGTGSDATLRWDGTDLDLLAAANNSVFKIGNGTNSFDVWLYGSAAGNYLLWDASANTLQPVAGAIIKPYIALADPGNAGAIPVTVSGYCPIVTAGAETRTLAAPTYIGQKLLLYAKTLVGNGVVTCATTLNEDGDNTITFSATGQAVELTCVEEGGNLRWRCPVADPASILSTV